MEFETILKEVQLKGIRSSGPGGQHVNKTASRVELSFSLLDSKGLTEAQKELLQKKLSSRLSSQGVLTLQCSESRSQHRNKKIIIERLFQLLEENLKVAKPRKKSKPSKSAIEKRLQSKKRQALKKSQRKPPKMD
ncbi:MAG: alternative ribosome rescue aminoacyl-tRNA hydrolase ArfB [Bacteroidota bacterium]